MFVFVFVCVCVGGWVGGSVSVGVHMYCGVFACLHVTYVCLCAFSSNVWFVLWNMNICRFCYDK